MKCNYEYYKSVASELDDDCKYLVEYIKNNTVFFDSPASTKYHHVYFGGLAIHCMEIYQFLVKRVKELQLPYNNSTLFLISVGHDFDKLGRYQYDPEIKNFSYRFLKMDGMFHGSRGFALLDQYLDGKVSKRSDGELIRRCISAHMADFDRWRVAKECWEENKHIDLVVLTHEADIYSTELDGRDFEHESIS